MDPLPRLAASLACLGLLAACGSPGGLRKPLPAVVSVHDPSFPQAMGSILRASFLPGNRITTLNNGNEIFPAMLAAIRGARHSITFETYIYDDGRIGDAFTAALAERARHGVHVKVVIDAFGGATRKAVPLLKQSGADVEVFHSLLSLDLVRYNYRTHRKLLIVDGRVGFIGGVGIADSWLGAGQKPDEWRDVHYRVEGPVVAQMQGAFHDDWFRTHHEVLQGSDFYPALKPKGRALAGVFYNTPRHEERKTDLMLHLAIAASRETLLIETPYFVPNDATCAALGEAVRRGVVKIIMPSEKTDVPMVRRASRRRWARLLAAGVALFEYQPTLVHSKLLIADGRFVSVGSANLDPRSRSLNEEANMNVLDDAFAREQTRLFEADLKLCRKVDGAQTESFFDLPADLLEQQIEDQL